MKTPIDVARGKIVDVSPSGEVTIKVQYSDLGTLIKRDYQECTVQFQDSRVLSGKQRRTCYALLREISDYTGMGLDPTKEYMKLKFIAEDLQCTMDTFSLSDASMSLVCAFERFLIEFILSWDIPCSFPLLDFVDDVGDYLYVCIRTQHCCVCGQPALLHPLGGKLEKGVKVLPLCEKHAEEAILFDKFREMYHISDGVVLDNATYKMYGLNKGGE